MRFYFGRKGLTGFSFSVGSRRRNNSGCGTLVFVVFIIFLIGKCSTSHASETEPQSNHTKMIQAACASLMYDVMQQYGKSFFCQTSNTLANSLNASQLTQSLDTNNPGITLTFSNVYYEDPNDHLSTLHYSYSSDDLNSVISLIQAGEGLTENQQTYLGCRNAEKTFKDNEIGTNKKYVNKEISAKDYEVIHKIQLESIARINKQCPDNNYPQN